MATTATPWCGAIDDKLYLQSGQFTSTLKTSQYIGGIDSNITGITYDGNNTPWTGGTDDKLYLQSGQFTSTLKTSQAIGSIDTQSTDISVDEDKNTPWIGTTDDKLYLQSGQFTSTLKTSEAISSIDNAPTGISYSLPGNTPWCGVQANKLYLQSGQFSSTLKTSQYIGSIDTVITGVSYDGNTPWIGDGYNKLYLQSGQFTSTLKTSQAVGSIDTGPYGICTNDYYGRTGAAVIYERSISHTITFSHISIGSREINRNIITILYLGQNILVNQSQEKILNHLLILGQSFLASKKTIEFVNLIQPIIFEQLATNITIYNRTVNHTITFGQLLAKNIDLIQQITFNHITTPTYLKGYSVGEIANWPECIYTNITRYWNQVAQHNNIPIFFEGTHRNTQDYPIFIEFRMDGPNITHINSNYYKIELEVNILYSVNWDHISFHETSRIKGILMDAMQDLCIHCNGNLLGILQLVQKPKIPTRVNDFGQVRVDMRLMQGTVEGSFVMYITV